MPAARTYRLGAMQRSGTPGDGARFHVDVPGPSGLTERPPHLFDGGRR